MSWLISGVSIGACASYSPSVLLDMPRMVLTLVFNLKFTGKMPWGLWIVSFMVYLLIVGTFCPCFRGNGRCYPDVDGVRDLHLGVIRV
jgi:hypothetical protein